MEMRRHAVFISVGVVSILAVAAYMVCPVSDAGASLLQVGKEHSENFPAIESGGTERFLRACKPTTVDDVLDAAQISKQLEKDTDQQLRQGDTVPGTSGYKVVSVYTATLDGNALKAMVAAKTYVHGQQLRMLVFHVSGGAAMKLKTLTQMNRLTALPDQSGSVRSFFWDALNTLNIVNEEKFPSETKFIISGHGLGGALAMVFAYQIHFRYDHFWGQDENRLITFGSPRVGNRAFAKTHDRIIAPHKKLRIVYNRDTIPHLLGQHVSREIWIQSRRSKKDVWNMCNLVCSKPNMKYTISDHALDKYIVATQSLKANLKGKTKFANDQCATLQPGAPLKQKSDLDVTKVVALTPNSVIEGRPAKFEVSTKGAGDGNLEISCFDPKGKSTNVDVEDVGNGVFECIYVPHMVGRYVIVIKYGGKEVPLSPYHVKSALPAPHEPDVGRSEHVHVYGPGLEAGLEAGRLTTFTIDVTKAGAGSVACTVEGPRPTDCDLKDHGNSFTAEYYPIIPGRYVIAVKFDDVMVPKCPVSVTVEP